jgi:integrase
MQQVLPWVGDEARVVSASGAAPAVGDAVVGKHLAVHVGPNLKALVFRARKGAPLFRPTIARDVWRPAVRRAGLHGVTFHGLRHSFVAILMAAGCNVREMSEMGRTPQR